MAAEEDPVATVVVVTWANVGGLDRCLDSLEQQSLPRRSFRVLVVDNDSRDGTAEVLRERATAAGDGLRVIRLRRNAGFAGGAHAGLAAVGTPFAVLLNDDAVADHGFLAAVLAPFNAPQGDGLAAVTGLVVLADPMAPARAGTSRHAPGVLLDNSGRAFVTAADPRAAGPARVRVNSTGNEVRRDGNAQDRDWLRSLGAVDDDGDGDGDGDGGDGRRAPGSPLHSPTDVFGFCGAAAALRLTAVRQVGGIDAGLFLYWEDTDLSWRLRRSGWRIAYQPTARVTHAHSASSGTRSAVFRFHNERNRLVVLTRHAPAGLIVTALARYIARTTIMLVTGPRGLLPGRVRVLASYGVRLPGLLRRRGRREPWERVPRRDLDGWIVDVPASTVSTPPQTPSRRWRSSRARAARTTAGGPPIRR